ncbi:LicD family protein [Actinomyces radicidentis]|uniref:LicD family protein n=1 Tax=Actinomyces radicidentis TaxID=111015 RepID=UPI0028E9C0C8|nr:LicD family protein [Actinomyces radicidentis]
MRKGERLSDEESRQVQLGVLLELERFCREHELTYVLAFGTLIGAMRHEGFIPWDDDIDVYMPRADFERLYGLSRSGALPEHLRLTSYRDRSSIYPFFKLVDTRTHVEESYVGVEQDLGLWVDIFPLEHVDFADRRIRLTRLRALRHVWKRSIAASDPHLATSRRAVLVKRLIYPVTRRMNPYEIARRSDELARAAHVADAKDPRYVMLVDNDMDNNTLRPEDLLPVRRTLFEGAMLPIPARAEDVLTARYGDWRRVPSPEERPPAHVRTATWAASDDAR